MSTKATASSTKRVALYNVLCCVFFFFSKSKNIPLKRSCICQSRRSFLHSNSVGLLMFSRKTSFWTCVWWESAKANVSLFWPCDCSVLRVKSWRRWLWLFVAVLTAVIKQDPFWLAQNLKMLTRRRRGVLGDIGVRFNRLAFSGNRHLSVVGEVVRHKWRGAGCCWDHGFVRGPSLARFQALLWIIGGEGWWYQGRGFYLTFLHLATES